MSGIATNWKSLRRQVWEHRGNLRLAVRITIAALLGFAVAHFLNVPLPLWTVLTAVILTQVSFGSSVRATINYLLGTLSGAVYAGVLATLVPHTSEIALLAVLAMTVGPLALLAAIYPSFSAATFTGVLVVLLPGLTHTGPAGSAFYRVIEVTVGGVTALAVSLVLPTRARALAIEAAAQMLDLMARSLPELFSGFAKTGDAAAFGRIQVNIGEALARYAGIAAEARHERLNFYAAEPTLEPLQRTLLRLRHDVVMIGRTASEPLPQIFQDRFGARFAQAATAMHDYLRRSGEALARRRKPPPLDAAEAAFDDCVDIVGEIRRDGLTVGLPVDMVERIFALGFALDQLRQHFHELERCVTDTARWR
jgi:uncharacterized membrane protein YccC